MLKNRNKASSFIVLILLLIYIACTSEVVYGQVIPAGDLNKDFMIDMGDLAILADQWLTVNENCLGSACTDLNDDQSVNLADFSIISEKWQRQYPALIISEFMASNGLTLQDAAGDYPDWIEIHNPSVREVNTDGWYLTNKQGDPTRWRFPDVTIQPGAYLTVFASDNQYGEPETELRTDFNLSLGGDYLALIAPDGSIASEFVPTYPPQFRDVSYGIAAARQLSNIIDVGTQTKIAVPEDDSMDISWMMPQFDDSNWQTVSLGIGYNNGVSGCADAPPVAYWPFDDGSGLMTSDISGNGHNGQLLNNPTWTTGIIGGGILFDGINDVVEVPFDEQFHQTSFSIAAWVKPMPGSYRAVISAREDAPTAGYILYASPSNTWQFWTGYGGGWHILSPGSGLADVKIDQWQHLAVTFHNISTDGNVVTGVKIMYINGEEVGRSETARMIPGKMHDLRIGAGRNEQAIPEYFFNGTIDELCIFDRAVSQAEISCLAGGLPLIGDSFSQHINTDIGDQMFESNSSVYLRIPFAMSNISLVDSLTLNIKYDDGFIAYLNGQKVASRNSPESLQWDSNAAGEHSNSNAIIYEAIDLTGYVDELHNGDNILAIHGLNLSDDDNDFLIVPKLAVTGNVQYAQSNRHFMVPTPGTSNGLGQDDLGPIISDVTHSPAAPAENDNILITAKIAPAFRPVNADSVTLHYRIMFGQEYTITMMDDGMHGDNNPDDGVYGAIIPGSAADAGQMVRYYITTEDNQDSGSRWPLFHDPTESAQYLGLVIDDPQFPSDLPVLHWFVDNESASETRSGTRASLYYDGVFYDNVFVRIRGSAALGWPKHKFKFDFYRDRFFSYSPDRDPVEEFNLQSYYREVLSSSNTSYMRENLAYQFLNDADVPACDTFHMHVRRNGKYYGLFSFIEQVDERYLQRHGFDSSGAMYKSINCCAGTLRTLSTGSYPSYYRKVTQKDQPWDDLIDFTYGINASNADRFGYLFDNVDLPQVINYMAAQCVMTNHDRLTKNYYVYREPETLLWHVFPWDLDQPFTVNSYLTHENWSSPFYGNATHTQELSGGRPNPDWQNHIYTVMFDNPVTREMYLRRVRTLMDRFMADDSAYFVERANNYYGLIKSQADIDNAKWHSGNIDNGFNEIININLPTRRDLLYNTYGPQGAGLIPDAQPDNPAIRFGELEYNPASHNQDQEYIELVNPNSFAVDISAWQVTGGIEFHFQPGTVIASMGSLYITPDVTAFRARTASPGGGEENFVQGNYKGHLSSWGETVNLLNDLDVVVDTISYEGNPSDQQKYLRITELMYHPVQGGQYNEEEYEFVELQNIGPETLDLSGVRFTGGIGFDFTNDSEIIQANLIDMTDVWRYEQGCEEPSSDWYQTGYDHSHWPEGKALLYVESSGLPAPKNTALSLGCNTYYFRKQFFLDADPDVDEISLELNTVIDDGAVFYLNGDEVYRLGMDDGIVSYDTPAGRSVNNALLEGPFVIPIDSLVNGENIIAIEVHQRIAGSSDIVLGITLDATVTKATAQTQSSLEPGRYLLLVKNIPAFESRYGNDIDIAGQYTSSLANNGESIKLEDYTNSTIMEFSYDDDWYGITDGDNFSLTIVDAYGSDPNEWDSRSGWRPSAAVGGSPGYDDSDILPEPDSVVINEVLAHSHLTTPDWIELHNTTDQPINIGGWFLSDSDADNVNKMKYEIEAGTTITANGYLVFSQATHFGNTATGEGIRHIPFALSEGGEMVHLQSATGGVLTGYETSENFDASESNIAFGRFVKSALDGGVNFVAMSQNTSGEENAYPKVGPVIITEIMYNPGDLNLGGEYIELHNVTDDPVVLGSIVSTEISPDVIEEEFVSWKFSDGIAFSFTDSTTITAGGYLIIAKNPQAFKSYYTSLPAGVEVLGPFENDTSLSNGGERLQLIKPGDKEFGKDRYWIRVERVNYDDDSPWPTEADGNGESLSQKTPDTAEANYGNDVANWNASNPTPGH